MKVLITGNMGYVGPVVTRAISAWDSSTEMIGLDTAYFGHSLFDSTTLPEYSISHQIFRDVRDIQGEDLENIDAIIHLCAISNDPMGKNFSQATIDINLEASKRLVNLAKFNGVKRFVFASSCSVYGLASNEPRSEIDELNPLTEYSKSKIKFEEYLYQVSDENFTSIALRFATACGASPRLRLDLVLNDFVFSAIANPQISEYSFIFSILIFLVA